MLNFIFITTYVVIRGWIRILFNGLAPKETAPVHLAHFLPVSTWTVDLKGPTYQTHENAKEISLYIIDESTGDRYLNESLRTIKNKLIAVAIAAPLVESVGLLCNAANLAVKTITLAHLWNAKNDQTESPLHKIAKDLGIILITPLLFIGMELSAIYGIVRPLDGRKLFAAFERASYKRSLLAPCFQAEPKEHLLHGNIEMRDQW